MDDEELGVKLRNMSREQLEKLVLALVRLLGPERRSDKVARVHFGAVRCIVGPRARRFLR